MPSAQKTIFAIAPLHPVAYHILQLLVVADTVGGEIKKKVHSPCPNNSGVVSTAGGIIFTCYTDGTVAAYDDTTLEQLWKINVGSGFNDPTMTFEVGSKQYVAITRNFRRPFL